MKSRMVSALSASLVAYCIFAVAWGSSGVRAEREARILVDRMVENVETLETRNRDLKARLEWMANEEEAMRLEARSLGYLERDALLVRLPRAAERSDSASTGSFIAWEHVEGVSDADLKLAGLLSGLAVFFASLFVPDGGGRRRKSGLSGAEFRLERKPA
ncbi:MAG: hypothetical protein JXA15_10960 [Spirochaetales bacterium]|nr:hypothetical protein [Spirochaetales bacterium]